MNSLLTRHADLNRSRLAVSSHAADPTLGGNWRVAAAAPATRGTTGLSTTVCSSYVTGTNRSDGPFEQMIKRPARHLGTRST